MRQPQKSENLPRERSLAFQEAEEAREIPVERLRRLACPGKTHMRGTCSTWVRVNPQLFGPSIDFSVPVAFPKSIP